MVITIMPPEERNAAGTGGGGKLRDAFWNNLKMESEQSLSDMHSSQGSLGSVGRTSSKEAGNKKAVGRKNAGGILRAEAESSGKSDPNGSGAPSTVPQEQRRRKTKGSTVMFAPNVKVKVTIGLWEYTDDEYDLVWTTDEDRQRNQVDIIQTVQWMRENAQANLKDTDTLSSRGLEHMRTPLSYEQKKINREKVLRAVFAEQERQWLEEFHNSRDIAAASGTHSELAKKTAVQHAITDEQYVAARRRSSHIKALQSLEGRGRSASMDAGRGRRRRSSRVSFEKHGDQVLDEIILVAGQCEREDPVGRRRSVETEGDESATTADKTDAAASSVPVISWIEKNIIDNEVMAGRMVRNDGNCDLIRLCNDSSQNSFSLDEFQASGCSISFDEIDETPDGGRHPQASPAGNQHASFNRRASFSFVRQSASKDLTGLGPGGDGTMATILDDYYSSDGSACGSDDDTGSMRDDTPLLHPGQGGASGRAHSRGSNGGVLGIPTDGKETFMSAFRKSKQRERSRERSKGPAIS